MSCTAVFAVFAADVADELVEVEVVDARSASVEGAIAVVVVGDAELAMSVV
jgi:hypothetical protein